MSATMQAVAAETGGASQQFVTFNVRDELFGVPLGEVQEIIRMPELVQVPLCAPSLEGIANLRGVVLPVTSLRRVFGTDDAEHDDATRVVVVNRAGAPVGFVVDRMASVIAAEASEIEGAESMQGTLHSDLLRGVVKRATGLIMLLDPARLTATDLRGEGRTGNGHGLATAGMAAERTERGQAATVDDVQLVSFEAAGQEYAFPIEDVQEIVQVPGTVTQVPQAQPQVVGVMTLRERLLPLVSLRRMFALPGATVDEHSRIVVVSAGGPGSASVGIVMDKVKEVLRVSRSLIDPVPAMLAGGDGGGQNAFEAICRLNGGKRLVTILSAARMFRDVALRGALATATGKDSGQEDSMADDTGRVPGTSGTAGAFDEEQFVVFRLAGEEYGVPIDSVQEIVRVPDELTHVPKAASFRIGGNRAQRPPAHHGAHHRRRAHRLHRRSGVRGSEDPAGRDRAGAGAVRGTGTADPPRRQPRSAEAHDTAARPGQSACRWRGRGNRSDVILATAPSAAIPFGYNDGQRTHQAIGCR